MFIAFLLLRGGRHTYHQDQRILDVQKKPRLARILYLDWLGTALFVSAGILILLALNWGSTNKWSSVKVIVSFAVGAFLFLLCLGWEVFVQHRQDTRTGGRLHRIFPMLPFEIFTSINVVGTQAVAFVSGMVMLVMFYYLSIFFTIVSGASLTHTGVQLLYFAPGIVCYFPRPPRTYS